MGDLELGPLRVGIIGAGRLGRLIGSTLAAAGVELAAVSARTDASRTRASRQLGVPAFEQPTDVARASDLVIVCVPDDAVEAVLLTLASDLSDDEVAALRVVHTCGCLGLDALEPLAARGAAVAALHPLQTVTDGSSTGALAGAAAAVTADDPAARTMAHALAHACGMHPFDLADEARPLYHAASSFAANFTVTLLAAVEDITGAAGVPEGVARHAFAALARAAADRVEAEGAAAALTGPIVRGDTGTVAAHISALDDALPQHATTYRALARATASLAVGSGALAIDDAHRIASLLPTVNDPAPEA